MHRTCYIPSSRMLFLADHLLLRRPPSVISRRVRLHGQTFSRREVTVTIKVPEHSNFSTKFSKNYRLYHNIFRFMGLFKYVAVKYRAAKC
jgi:hypothetical protein